MSIINDPGPNDIIVDQGSAVSNVDWENILKISYTNMLNSQYGRSSISGLSGYFSKLFKNNRGESTVDSSNMEWVTSSPMGTSYNYSGGGLVFFDQNLPYWGGGANSLNTEFRSVHSNAEYGKGFLNVKYFDLNVTITNREQSLTEAGGSILNYKNEAVARLTGAANATNINHENMCYGTGIGARAWVTEDALAGSFEVKVNTTSRLEVGQVIDFFGPSTSIAAGSRSLLAAEVTADNVGKGDFNKIAAPTTPTNSIILRGAENTHYVIANLERITSSTADGYVLTLKAPLAADVLAGARVYNQVKADFNKESDMLNPNDGSFLELNGMEYLMGYDPSETVDPNYFHGRFFNQVASGVTHNANVPYFTQKRPASKRSIFFENPADEGLSSETLDDFRTTMEASAGADRSGSSWELIGENIDDKMVLATTTNSYNSFKSTANPVRQIQDATATMDPQTAKGNKYTYFEGTMIVRDDRLSPKTLYGINPTGFCNIVSKSWSDEIIEDGRLWNSLPDQHGWYAAATAFYNLFLDVPRNHGVLYGIENKIVQKDYTWVDRAIAVGTLKTPEEVLEFKKEIKDLQKQEINLKKEVYETDLELKKASDEKANIEARINGAVNSKLKDKVEKEYGNLIQKLAEKINDLKTKTSSKVKQLEEVQKTILEKNKKLKIKVSKEEEKAKQPEDTNVLKEKVASLEETVTKLVNALSKEKSKDKSKDKEVETKEVETKEVETKEVETKE